MKMIYGDLENFDLDEPIPVTAKQRDELRKELLAIGFYEVEFRSIRATERRVKRLGDQKRWFHVWSPKELALVLSLDKDVDEIGLMLAKSGMSVLMRRVKYLPEVLQFADARHKDFFALNKNEQEKMIEEMLKKKMADKQDKREKIKKLKEDCDKTEKLLEWKENNKQRQFAIFDAIGKSDKKKAYVEEMLRLATKLQEFEAELDKLT